MTLRHILNELTPLVFRRATARKYGYFGDYATWEEARKECTGYDAEAILNKVRDALLKVKRGEAIYERDSVLFDTIQYSWPLLAGLLWAASKNENRLILIDFGGSLGSSYFQNRKFLGHLNPFRWNIVEQATFVNVGRALFEDEYLRFYYDIDECIKKEEPNMVILSSVLPYLEEPYALLEKIADLGPPYLIIDRTPFLPGRTDRLTIQKVPPSIYDASYPAWFLAEKKFLSLLSDNYELITGFPALGGIIDLDGVKAEEKGFVFVRKGL